MAEAPADPDGAMSRTLRSAGLRVTMPRLAMLTWLAGHPHATAEAVAAGVREQVGAVSTQAIYDMLTACSAAGLLRRIEPAGHPARYERRVGDSHHHLVCRRCGRTEDVDRVVGNQSCLSPARNPGYAVEEAEVVFWGLCPACTASKGSPGGETTDEEASTRR